MNTWPPLIVNLQINKSINGIMKRLLLALSAILLTVCSKDTTEAVRQFAADFAIKVSKNQKDSLLSVWPDVAKADSLVLSFVEDSIKIEPNAKGDSILIHYDPKDPDVYYIGDTVGSYRAVAVTAFVAAGVMLLLAVVIVIAIARPQKAVDRHIHLDTPHG